MFLNVNTAIYWTLILSTVQEISYAIPSNSTELRFRRQSVKCPGKFECRNGQCINKFDICDGAENCGDGSDELQATCIKNNIKCPRGSFRCAYGGCVDSDKKCNGEKDCADNSDELSLTCPGFKWLNGAYPKCGAEQFQCRNGQCIDKYSVCDGATDCADKSDETVTHCNTEFFGCPKNSFQCAYGGCVDDGAMCDFKIDCADGSDEDYILCNRDAPPILPPTKTTTPPTVGQVITVPPPKPPTQRPPNSCIVPFSAGTSYSLSTCEGDCNLKPGDVVNGNVTVVFLSCQGSFVAPNVDIPYVVCNQGRWAPENHACVRVCRPLVSSTLIITCKYRDQSVSCEEGNRPGTKAKIRCKDGYTPIGGNLLENECLSSGEWLYPRQRCSYKCGILDSKSTVPLISYGGNANISYHPWNAGLYVKVDDKVKHICGGTLITPYTILTAAHCVFRQSGEMRLTQNLKIGLAKYYRDWFDERDVASQKVNVENIFVSPIYDGTHLHYLHDIAILELTQSVKLSRFIMPACIDTNRDYRLSSNMLGTVVGWGENENKEPNPTLQIAKLPYYSRSDCISFINRPEQITKDKFCAFYTNGTNVQKGDSGEGITFEFDHRHYVFGIVSTQVNVTVSTFTDVSNEEHIKFIQNILNNIARKYM